MLVAVMFLCLLATGLPAAETSAILADARTDCSGDAQLTAAAGGYELRFDDPKSSARLLPATEGAFWDWAGWRYFAVDLENLNATKQMRLTLHIFAGAEKKQEVVIGIALNPQEKRTLRLEIPHREIYQLADGIPGPKTLDATKIAQVELKLQWPFESKLEELVHGRLTNARLEERLSAAPAALKGEFLPFVDRYGQYRHGDWPLKVKTAEDLRNHRKTEARELATVKEPAGRNQYGGWSDGPQLKATGAFRTEKYDGKWYLVDPEGRLFFLHALDVLYPQTDAVNLTKHPDWYENPQDNREEGRISHTDLNLRLKYGTDDYKTEFFQTLNQRLPAWGFNGIGDWASGEFIEQSKLPYVLQLVEFNNQTMPKIAASKLKFYDVFDDECISRMRTLIADRAEKSPVIRTSLTDPRCIGYFIDNEMRFGDWKSREGRIQLIEDVLKCPAKQAIKREFLADLKAKYFGIDKLNEAWQTSYESWEAMLNATTPPAVTPGYQTDEALFMQKAADQYFRLGRDAIKSLAPERLYLGCRLLSTECISPVLSAASKKFCDVMTVNIYAHTPANLSAVAVQDMPVLVGEFHFGIPDRGMFSPGLCLAGTTQAERALAYTRFMQGALAHPNIVGACWFQFRDQPLTGRWDGEGYEVGFVDITDTPYAEMTRAARAVGENLYRYRQAGKLNNSMK